MGSIEAGRPPDGDSYSDEDENAALTKAVHDQLVLPFRQSQWTPEILAFRPYHPSLRPVLGTGTESVQHHRRAAGFHLTTVAPRCLVTRLTKDIAETYKVCNPNFTCSVLKRYLTTPSKGVSNDGQDNKDTDLILYVDCILINWESNRRYVVKDMLGKGSFGQVCKCSTSDSNEDVAVKVIKNQPAYHQQAIVEIGICKLLNNCDPFDTHNIVRFRDHFEFAGHLCLVFELLNANLYELLKFNNHKGLSMKLVRRFTRQMLEALTALREAAVIHCDLKPENILLQLSLENAEIKLIDFGSACLENRPVYEYIQSRFYRSPEVLLRHPYTTAIDMWSLGCVAAELFLGLPLFPGACEYDLFRFMIEILGCQPPDDIIHGSQAGKNFFKLTSSAPLSGQMAIDGQSSVYQFLSEAEFEARQHKKPKVGRRYFGHNKLEDMIVAYPTRKKMTQEEIDEEIHTRVSFVDFLKGVLHFDPRKRWTPGQALQHPFLTGEQLLVPFIPPPEPNRSYVGQGITTNHNPVAGHWFGAGLSPQMNVPGMGRYPNSGYHGLISLNNSFSSAGSVGSHGDCPGLGSSLGSYGESTSMPYSFSNTPVTGVNGHYHGGAAGGGFVGSPDNYHPRMHVTTVPTLIGVSPSNYRPVPLGASPSHNHQPTPAANFLVSPSSNFVPSPISYVASPSSNYHMSPSSQLMLSPSSPSHISPSRHAPTSPARAGASALPKIAYQNIYRNRQHGSQLDWPRNQQPNTNGNGSFVRVPGVHCPNLSHKYRSGAHFGLTSSTGFGDGTLGAMLNLPDNASEASEELSPPPDPKDWDPGYSDEQLLGDLGEVSSSSVTVMDVSDVSSGVSRLEPFSGPGEGLILMGYQHGQSTSFSGQSRSNGSGQGQPGLLGNSKGSGVSPKNSAHGQQPPYSQHPLTHGSYTYAPQTSPSRFGLHSAMLSQRQRPQPPSHFMVLQSSPEGSSSVGAAFGQTMGECASNVLSGLLAPAQRDHRVVFSQVSRTPGASHPVSVMGIQGGTGSNNSGSIVGPTYTAVDPGYTPWSPASYLHPYAQNLPQEPSSLSRRPAMSLPPIAPGKTHGNKRLT